jgi:hypothetical protein
MNKQFKLFFFFLVVLILPVLCQASATILTSASPNHTVTSGSDEQVYGTSASNQIILEGGAKAELINFPGHNSIQIQSSLNLFTVSRSGTVVTFQGADGTVLKIPATSCVQTVDFSDQDALTLSIYNGQVMLDDQVVTPIDTLIEDDSGTSNTLPFSDTVNRPANINPDTVITTKNHGLWVVTEGSYYAGTQRYETAYFYEENNHVKMSYMDSGVTFTVVEMPDLSPVRSSTVRPGNMNPGTILILDNEQVWKITEGGYYGATTQREDVIIFLMNDDYHMSFQISGVTMTVEQISG